jgi:hypothetical protein
MGPRGYIDKPGACSSHDPHGAKDASHRRTDRERSSSEVLKKKILWAMCCFGHGSRRRPLANLAVGNRQRAGSRDHDGQITLHFQN